MRIRGITLSLMAALGALLVFGPVPASAAQNPPPIAECRDELGAFQGGRELGVLGQPWTQGENVLNRLRRKCSLLGWYEGMRDYCSSRSQLASGKAGRHGLELCLYKDTRGSMEGKAMGMDALAEMMADVDLSKPMSKAQAETKYRKLDRDLHEESSEMLQSSALDDVDVMECWLKEEEASFLDLGKAAALREFHVNCYKRKIVEDALGTLQSSPYTEWYDHQIIGLTYAKAEQALILVKADIASTQELLATNDARISGAYRRLYETTNAKQQATLRAQIKELESQQESLRISLQNAIDRRQVAEAEFEESQRAYQLARAKLN